jgi:hypothetical protein
MTKKTNRSATTERLTIRNFGPIREAQIEVKSLTIFVGPQATGKSLAAQILHFLRGIEDLLLPDALLLNHGEIEIALSALKSWLGSTPTLYAGPGTKLCWVGSALPGEEATYELWWDQSGAHINAALRDRVWRRAQAFDAARIRGDGAPEPKGVPEQVYIPAGRAVYSFIPSYSRLYLQLAPRWPGHVTKFYETLGTTLAELWQEQEWERSAASEMEQVVEPSKPTFIQRRIAAIMKGKIQYDRDEVSLLIGSKRFGATAFAAGQMEIWPFCAMAEASFGEATRVYFEEPEAHLHPGAQRSVIEIVAHLVRQGGQFVITTHSPYVLYAINNCLMAHKVLDKGRKLPREFPKEIALPPEKVAAYRFSSDGAAHDIMDPKVGLIDEDELDQVADELGATFTRLQEQMEDAE